ncbi:hypothetical protein BDR26DRAFT_923174 [Obelidium mucronatum]|nr:hypothetical protein BDR26DRAFT_923174 [Obelidium mucronatum]
MAMIGSKRQRQNSESESFNSQTQTQSQTAGAHTLSLELLLRVMQFLPTETKKTCALVCSTWLSASRVETWSNVSVSRLSVLVSQFKLESIHLAESRTRNIKRLNLSNSSKDLNALFSVGSFLLLNLTRNINHLNILLGSPSTAKDTVSNSSNNTQISQSANSSSSNNARFLDPDQLISILTALAPTTPKSLNTLSLRGGKALSNSRLSQILSSFAPSISTLKLTCPSVSTDSLISSLSCLSSLSTLTLNGGTSISSSLINHLASSSNFPQLKSCNLFPNQPIHPSVFLELPQNDSFVSLESLAFDADPDLNLLDSWNDSVKALSSSLAQSRKLQELAIAGDGIITSTSFLALTAALGPTLKKLCLNQFDSIQVVEVGFSNTVGAAAPATTTTRTATARKSITPVMGVALAKSCKTLRKLVIHREGEDVSGNAGNNMGEMVMEVYREVMREFC